MLNNHGFDLWSEDYDNSVKELDQKNQYPFSGYAALMNAIYGTVMNKAPAKVLDIGFGTATLTSKLYAGGNAITGIDFSSEMIGIALSKMPEANLLQWDFTQGVPAALKNQAFDFIVSTYALHHLTDDAKADFIIDLVDVLEPSGVILIGDVCFPTRDDLLLCRKLCGDDWDEEESYLVFSELYNKLGSFLSLTFHKFSFCAGVIELRKYSEGAYKA